VTSEAGSNPVEQPGTRYGLTAPSDHRHMRITTQAIVTRPCLLVGPTLCRTRAGERPLSPWGVVSCLLIRVGNLLRVGQPLY